MTAEAVVRLRRLAGYAGALLGLAIAFAIYDAMASQFGQDPNLFHALPGERVHLNGPMPEKAEAPTDLVPVGNVSGLTLRFEDVQTGFWLGGRQWKGVAIVAADADPGLRQLSVTAREAPAVPAGPTISVQVYPSEEALRRDSPSLIRQATGLAPGLAAAAAFPLFAAAFLASFLLSRQLEKLLAQTGKAEIFMLKKSPEGSQISFGLGGRQGIEVGDLVTLHNEAGLAVGTARVISVTESDSVALTSRESDVHLGYVVSMGDGKPEG